MTGSEIRRRFLEHFARREHLILPSAPLVPRQDPTTLFNSAGMQPLQPYYRGLEEPPAPRLASAQKCFRTDDLEEVGRTDRHDTFFEMLGNFAPTGDYFKEKAIPWAWELVTEGFGIPVEKLRVTTHPSDDEARRLWAETTPIRGDWIYRDDTNWWGLELGPCGPDSELWFDRGIERGCGLAEPECFPDHCERFVEFWNLVFPQFDRQPDGTLLPLPRPAIDTGLGLERMAAILQGVETIFDTDLFRPLIEFAAGGRERNQTLERIIADHLRAMTFLIAEGVLPSNEGRGYVLRRIIRRAVLQARRLGLGTPLSQGVGIVVSIMGDQYPELALRRKAIEDTIGAESDRFAKTLEQGMDLFEGLAARNQEVIPGEEAFLLHDTFGFPIDLTRELAQERSITVDMPGFQAQMEAQRMRSRSTFKERWAGLRDLPATEFLGYHSLESAASVIGLRSSGQQVEEVGEGDQVEVFLDRTPFYGEAGGQVGDSGTIAGPEGRLRVEDTQRPAEGRVVHLGTMVLGRLRLGDSVTATVDAERRRQIARHHSATHLLHRALREVLGDQVVQKGSWVGPDHTTFDIPFDRPMTKDELARVNARVNEQVRAALPFHERHLPYQEAVRSGAMHLFEEKYGDVVRVVCFGEWTCELCGGTHVETTAEVGLALITSESSVGAGLRRIDMVVGASAERLVHRRMEELTELAHALGGTPEDVPLRVAELRGRLGEAERRVRKLQDELRTAQVKGRRSVTTVEASVPLVMEEVEAEDMDDLRGYADRFMEALKGKGVVAVTSGDRFVIKVSRDLAEKLDANRLRQAFGRGGGRPELVQGKLERKPQEAFVALLEALR